MKIYVVICDLRRTGIHTDSAHGDKASAMQRAQEVADELVVDTIEGFGSCASPERYNYTTWTVDDGETGTVYVKETKLYMIGKAQEVNQ